MAKYWVANNPNSEINDAKAQKIAELSATSASLADLNNIASSSATAAERDYRTMVVDCGAAAGSGSVYAVIPYNCNVLSAHLVIQAAEDGSGSYGFGDGAPSLANNAGSGITGDVLATHGTSVGTIVVKFRKVSGYDNLT